jgi:dolichol kinase
VPSILLFIQSRNDKNARTLLILIKVPNRCNVLTGTFKTLLYHESLISKTLKMKGHKEILRKLCHILFGVLIVAGLRIIEQSIFIRLLLILFLFLILVTIVNLKYEIKLLDKIGKESEKKFPLKGAIFFLVSTALVILLFPRDIALAAIIVLTFGDSVSYMAGFFGAKYKVNPFRKWKSLFGTFCGMVVAFLFAIIVIDPLSAAIGAFFGMIAEAISIKLGETDADDNLVVPLAAATAIYFLNRINLAPFL